MVDFFLLIFFLFIIVDVDFAELESFSLLDLIVEILDELFQNRGNMFLEY
jgi:hypothetical protein